MERDPAGNADPDGGGAVRRLLRRVSIWIAIGALLNLGIFQLTTGWTGLQSLERVAPLPLLLGTGLTFLPWFLHAIRVRIWTDALGRRIDYRAGLRVVVSSEVLAAVTPTAVGGAPAKATFLYREGLSLGSALSLTALGSLEDGIFFLVAVPLAVWLSPSIGFAELGSFLADAFSGALGRLAQFTSDPVGPDTGPLGWGSPGAGSGGVGSSDAGSGGAGLSEMGSGGAGLSDTGSIGTGLLGDHAGLLLGAAALIAVLLVVGFAIFRRTSRVREPHSIGTPRGGRRARLGQRVEGWWESLRRSGSDVRSAAALLWTERRRLVLTLPLTGLQWCARYAVVSALAWGMGLPVDLPLLFVLQCFVFGVMTLVPSPGAAGGAEGAFLLFHHGIAGTDLPLLLLGWRTLTFLLPVSVGAFLLLGLDRADRRAGGSSN